MLMTDSISNFEMVNHGVAFTGRLHLQYLEADSNLAAGWPRRLSPSTLRRRVSGGATIRQDWRMGRHGERHGRPKGGGTGSAPISRAAILLGGSSPQMTKTEGRTPSLIGRRDGLVTRALHLSTRSARLPLAFACGDGASLCPRPAGGNARCAGIPSYLAVLLDGGGWRRTRTLRLAGPGAYRLRPTAGGSPAAPTGPPSFSAARVRPFHLDMGQNRNGRSLVNDRWVVAGGGLEPPT